MIRGACTFPNAEIRLFIQRILFLYTIYFQSFIGIILSMKPCAILGIVVPVAVEISHFH